jgi:hypothetical protein
LTAAGRSGVGRGGARRGAARGDELNGAADGGGGGGGGGGVSGRTAAAVTELVDMAGWSGTEREGRAHRDAGELPAWRARMLRARLQMRSRGWGVSGSTSGGFVAVGNQGDQHVLRKREGSGGSGNFKLAPAITDFHGESASSHRSGSGAVPGRPEIPSIQSQRRRRISSNASFGFFVDVVAVGVVYRAHFHNAPDARS